MNTTPKPTPVTDELYALMAEPHLAHERANVMYVRAQHLERQNAELLEACKEAVKVLERMDTLRHVDPSFPALDKLRAAISKATE